MSCVTLLRTGLLFFSILISGEASPCQQKRDAPLDLFGDDVLDDGSFTLAFGTSTDGDVLSSENSYPGVSIFSNSIDGLGSAAVDSFIQTSNPDSQMDFASDGGNQDVAGLSFSGINLEGVSGEDLLAQLPDFGGITDFSFKDLENGNEKSCPADGNTATQTEQEKFPGLSEQTTMYSDLSPEDKRKCPSINGKQPVALCCFGAYFPEKSIQAGCHRPHTLDFPECLSNFQRCCVSFFLQYGMDCTHGWAEGWEQNPNPDDGLGTGSIIRPFKAKG